MTWKVINKKTEETEDVPGTTQRRKIQASPNKNRNDFQDQIYSREKKKQFNFLGIHSGNPCNQYSKSIDAK